MKKLVNKYLAFVGKSPVVRSFLVISPLYVLILVALSNMELIDGSMKNPNASLLAGLNLYGITIVTILHAIIVIKNQKIVTISDKGMLSFCFAYMVMIATILVII